VIERLETVKVAIERLETVKVAIQRLPGKLKMTVGAVHKYKLKLLLADEI